MRVKDNQTKKRGKYMSKNQNYLKIIYILTLPQTDYNMTMLTVHEEIFKKLTNICRD